MLSVDCHPSQDYDTNKQIHVQTVSHQYITIEMCVCVCVGGGGGGGGGKGKKKKKGVPPKNGGGGRESLVPQGGGGGGGGNREMLKNRDFPSKPGRLAAMPLFPM